jgi:hypothetical protein
MASNSGRCEHQPVPLNDEGHELPLDLNLIQLAEHKKSIERKMHLWLEFDRITKSWHHRLDANAHSLVLVLDAKPTIVGEP